MRSFQVSPEQMIQQLLSENRKLERENNELKRKQEIAHVNRVADDVYEFLNMWLNTPTPNHLSVEEDARNFSKAITKFIFRKSHN